MLPETELFDFSDPCAINFIAFRERALHKVRELYTRILYKKNKDRRTRMLLFHQTRLATKKIKYNIKIHYIVFIIF